jgi:hypothetical protein
VVRGQIAGFGAQQAVRLKPPESPLHRTCPTLVSIAPYLGSPATNVPLPRLLRLQAGLFANLLVATAAAGHCAPGLEVSLAHVALAATSTPALPGLVRITLRRVAVRIGPSNYCPQPEHAVGKITPHFPGRASQVERVDPLIKKIRLAEDPLNVLGTALTHPVPHSVALARRGHHEPVPASLPGQITKWPWRGSTHYDALVPNRIARTVRPLEPFAHFDLTSREVERCIVPELSGAVQPIRHHLTTRAAARWPSGA